MENIANRVRKIIAENIGVDSDIIADDRTLESLGADSTDLIFLELVLEEEFECEISNDEGAKWVTVGDVVTCIVDIFQQ